MTVEILPEDQYNATLVANVHPEDWVNPTPTGKYNLVVIGAGTAGLIAAAGASALGAKVALIERHLMGGDCLNVGCVPSKALIRAGRAFADVRDSGEFGVRVPEGTTVDFPAVMERLRRLRSQISPNDSAQRFKDKGVDVYLGEGRFTGPNTVEVDGQVLKYSKAVIATGARATAPPIPGLKEAGYLTNETLFTLTELPKSLVIIGAGPIGCEMAQSFARFGSKVNMVEMADQVLPREPAHIAGKVAAALAKDGVTVATGCHDGKVTSDGAKKIIECESSGGKISVTASDILVSAGRKPNVENLNLESVGVEYDERVGVKVNKFLQTTNKRIYAAGDICFPFQFTHAAEALAAIVIQNALFFRSKKTEVLNIPWSTYTDPEVAHVGLYPDQAKEKGIDTTIYSYSFEENDRAILDGEETGIVEIYAKTGTDKIIGSTICARHAGDMINEITLAMNNDLGLGAISMTIHPYPTQAEAVRRAAGEHFKSRLTPRIKKIMETWMRWHR